MHSHWVMTAIKAKPCDPKVIKFGRSGKKGREETTKKKKSKTKGRKERKEINKQPISSMAGLKKSIRNGEQEKEREREEKQSRESKKKGTNTCWSMKQQGSLSRGGSGGSFTSTHQETASFHHSRVKSWCWWQPWHTELSMCSIRSAYQMSVQQL